MVSAEAWIRGLEPGAGVEGVDVTETSIWNDGILRGHIALMLYFDCSSAFTARMVPVQPRDSIVSDNLGKLYHATKW